MRRLTLYGILVAFATVLLPALVATRCQAPALAPAEPVGGEEPRVRLYRSDIDTVVELPLERYVFGVVAAEMPAYFHFEALKAQAVLARTYGLRLIRLGERAPGHPEANVTDNPAQGQAWVSDAGLRARWGWLRSWWYAFRIRRAVRGTEGEVVTYQGELVFPAYHSTSGGRTEASENYWSRPLPYLRSVESPFEEASPYLLTEQRVPLREAYRRLGLPPPGTPLAPPTGPPGGAGERVADVTQVVPTEFTVIERFPSGRVKTVRVGGKEFTGRQVRERLGLRSNWFDVDVAGEDLVFRVRGYGHGVGLSQYGAHGMAQRGYDYRAILAHYYPGTTVERAYGPVR